MARTISLPKGASGDQQKVLRVTFTDKVTPLGTSPPPGDGRMTAIGAQITRLDCMRRHPRGFAQQAAHCGAQAPWAARLLPVCARVTVPGPAFVVEGVQWG